MNRSRRSAFPLLLTTSIATLSTLAGCSSSPAPSEQPSTTASAVTSCNPGQYLTYSGTCAECAEDVTGTQTSAYFTDLFNAIGTGKASYTVTNGVGTFTPPPPAFGITFPTPPTTQVTFPPYNGSAAGISYTETTSSIPNLSVTWSNWVAGTNGVTISATMSGTVNMLVSANLDLANATVTPTLNIVNLPITVTFGTDSSGNATITSVDVGELESYAAITGCGLADWCNVFADQQLNNYQSLIQQKVTTDFGQGLNGGPNNPAPFWKGIMLPLANVLGTLTDGTASPLALGSLNLPLPGTSSPAGTPSAWQFVSMAGYANGVVGANLSASNLCYIGTPPAFQCSGQTQCAPTPGQAETLITCSPISQVGGWTVDLQRLESGSWTTVQTAEALEPGSGLTLTDTYPNSQPQALLTYRVCSVGSTGGPQCGNTFTVNESSCACEPFTCGNGACGTMSDGCGGTIDCGGCAAGLVCGRNLCCPSGEEMCPATGTCLTAAMCTGAGGGGRCKPGTCS